MHIFAKVCSLAKGSSSLAKRKKSIPFREQQTKKEDKVEREREIRKRMPCTIHT